MSDNCDEKEPKRLPFSDIANGLNRGLESADPLRLAGLERLARARAVKETGFKREQERLKAKLGANHPRVAALSARIDANRELRRDVDLGLSRASTPAARPEKDKWVLHGHVRDRSPPGSSQPDHRALQRERAVDRKAGLCLHRQERLLPDLPHPA
jgi:hypothetical protein